MAPLKMVQLVYVHFTYVPTANKKKLFCQTMIKYCNRELSDFIVTLRDWMLKSMDYESTKVPERADIRYTEWRVLINDPELFLMYGMQFEKILVILGEQYVYWTFYMNSKKNKRQIQGKARIPLTYCPCCIHEKFRDILKEIKKYIIEYFKKKRAESQNQIAN